MTSKISRYLRLIVCLLLAAIVMTAPDGDISARSKRRSRKARTTKVRKSNRRSRVKRTRAQQPKLPVVVLGSTDPIDAPEPFVTLPKVKEIPQGLDGRTIAVWPSHGKYYGGSWLWQRPKLFGTVEDMLSRAFVDPYVVPMLENAGAYVVMPRERDFSHRAIIIDADRSSGDGKFASANGRHHWELQPDSTGYALPRGYIVEGENPFRAGRSGMVKTVEPDDSARRSEARWYGTVPEAGERAVYVSYQSYPNSATDATYTVNHLGGSSEVVVNQQMGGGTWVYIGTYPFADTPSDKPLVTLSNVSADEDAVVSADAVKIGGGLGIVGRTKGGSPSVSGYPAFLEGARYFIQSSGFPQYVYSPNGGTNDYVDDYKSRAHWVNYLAGGSVLMPDTLGLGVPVDMVLALHTDAGLTTDSTTVGTLGLYSTDDGNPLGNGTSRYANRDLTSSVVNQVVDDIRRLYDPAWSSRGIRDRKYYEVRDTKVPAMIMELLSHQNFEDMKRAHDPAFRFIVGRAVYKGVLKFLSERYSLPYTVQPLPVEAFAIHADGEGYYTLTWRPVEDKLEKSATPTYYIVYEAVGDSYYRPVAETTIPSWTTRINDDKIHAYYVVAGNDGGVSFPSETLALYDNHHRMPSVEIVNGFTRISGPQWTDGAEYAGFDFADGYGVPDGRDIHFIGSQYDFDPTGVITRGSNTTFGASSDTEASTPRFGNEFDYPLVHGEALHRAHRGFVSSSLKAFEEGKSSAKAVDLILGLQKTTRRAGSRVPHYQLFPKALRDRLTDYRRGGGNILLSGSYLASEIEEADSLTRDTVGRFSAAILGYKPYIEEHDSVRRVPRATTSMSVEPTQVVPGMPRIAPVHLASFRDGHSAGAGSPQAILPADESGLVIARYSDTGLPAAVAVEGNRSSHSGSQGRIVVLSFPLEAVENDAARDLFIADAMEYLIGPEPKVTEQVAPSQTADDKKSGDKNKKKKSKNKKKKEKKSSAAAETSTKSYGSGKKAAPVKDSKAVVPPPRKRQPDAPRAVPHRRK